MLAPLAIPMVQRSRLSRKLLSQRQADQINGRRGAKLLPGRFGEIGENAETIEGRIADQQKEDHPP